MSTPNRNDPCPCGSGKKYKKCCLSSTAAAAQLSSAPMASHGRHSANTTNTAPASGSLLQAVALHQSGKLEEAEAAYRSLLHANPQDSNALHYLGLIALQCGRYQEAVDLIGGAIRFNPAVPAFHCNLGNACKRLGLTDSAIAAYSEAVRLDPSFQAAYSNLGNLLLDQGKQEAAADCFHKAISIRPDFAEAHYNLGNTLRAQGKLDEAVACYRTAISIKPDYAEAYNNLGDALQNQGKLDEAVIYYQQACTLRPDHAETHYNLGNTFHGLGKPEAAIACYHRAITLKPDFAEACNNLGLAYKDLARLEEAIASYRQAIALKPDFAEAYFNLGVALKKSGELDKAIASYRKVLSLKPDHPDAYANLLYLHSFSRDISPKEECALAANWEKVFLSEHERSAARNMALSFDYPPCSGRRMKVGIVSAELGQHAVAEFLEPILEHIDHNRFHITLFPTIARSEARTTRLRELADEYISLVGVSDEYAANLIRSERIDLLIDTTAHMRGHRMGIFARRAAPVQCHYIGYHGTTGLTEMDWFIADDELFPLGSDDHFREEIWRLPRLWVAYRGDVLLPESRWVPNPDRTIWLGSFNNFSKIREDTLALWASVMHALPESRLLLKDRQAATPAVRNRIKLELERHGVNEERVEFIAWTPGWESHMALYDRLDIALDTIPLNSGTTAFDALWMGVPLIALEGDWMGGRLSSAILRALGRPEWVARNKQEYVALVSELARNIEKRKAMRTNQRTIMADSPLCDARGLASALENAFEGMFDRQLKKHRSR